MKVYTSNASVVELRPHHMLCSMAFDDSGYSPEHTSAAENVFYSLQGHPYQEVKIINSDDTICISCPGNAGACKKENVKKLDETCRNLLGIDMDVIYKYNDLWERFQEVFSFSKIQEICGNCKWWEQKCKDFFKNSVHIDMI